jgi:hypothetical protein
LPVIGVLEADDEQRGFGPLLGDLVAQAGERVQLLPTENLVEKEARAHVRRQHHEVEVLFLGQHDRLGEIPVGLLSPVGRADVAVKVSREDLKAGGDLVRVNASRTALFGVGELEVGGPVGARHRQIHRRMMVEVVARYRRDEQGRCSYEAPDLRLELPHEV